MASNNDVLGSVLSLWRYPVKSMMGEELQACAVTDRGLLGDRAYALIDPTNGKVVSAKNPKKWGRLFQFGASFDDQPRVGEPIPPVSVTFPDGTRVSSDAKDLAEQITVLFAAHGRREERSEKGRRKVRERDGEG